jgi:hypothetical protein
MRSPGAMPTELESTQAPSITNACRWIAYDFLAKESGQHVARYVIAGRPETSRNEHHVRAVKSRLGCLTDREGVVADGRVPDKIQSYGAEPISKNKCVAVYGATDQQFGARRNQFDFTSHFK